MNGWRGFVLIFGHSARQALRGKRLAALLVLVALPVFVSFMQVRFGQTVNFSDFVGTMLMGVFQFVLPFAGLMLGVAVLGDEIEGRTVTYLFTRPVPRAVIFLGRYLGYVAAFGAILVLAVLICANIFGSKLELTAPEVTGTVLIALAGFATYTAVFATLRALFNRAIFIGFFVGFVFEGFVSKAPATGISKLSIWHHLAVMETQLFSRRSLRALDEEILMGIEPTETLGGAATVIAIVAAVALVLGAVIVTRREVRVPAAVG